MAPEPFENLGGGLASLVFWGTTGNAHDLPDTKTFKEETMRFDARHRLIAKTTWLEPQGYIDPNAVPIAGGDGPGDPSAYNSSNEPVGLTTRFFYDNDLTDSQGLDGGLSVSSLDGSAPFTVDISALISRLQADGTTVGADGDFHAMAVVSPTEEISVAIYDGAQRSVATGVLRKDGTLVFAKTSTLDEVVNLAGFGDVVEIANHDGAGKTTKMRYDGNMRVLQFVDQIGKESSFTYDSNRNLLSQRDPNQSGSDCSFDERNRLVSCVDTFGDSVGYEYDLADNRTRILDGKQQATSVLFDPLNRMVTRTDRVNSVTQYSYDENNNIVRLKDGENESTTYAYDQRNLPVQVTFADHIANSLPGDSGYGVVQYEYDAAWRRVLATDQVGDTQSYEFDMANRQKVVSYRTRANSPSGPISDQNTFLYDESDRMVDAHSSRYQNRVLLQYDEAGRH